MIKLKEASKTPMTDSQALKSNTNQQVTRRGLLLVLSSPSGAGKTSLSKRLLAEDGQLHLSVSVTTRTPRPGETDGSDYHFVSKQKFDDMVHNNEMLEHAKVFGNFYGTPARPVENALQSGYDILFDIDWQGTQQLGERMNKDIVRIFLLPPSMQELFKRLSGRAQDSKQEVQSRMLKAYDEMSHWAEYDWVLINQDREISLQKIRTILDSERLRRSRQGWIGNFVQTLNEQTVK